MSWKVVTLLLALALVSLGGALYASQKMVEIDAAYTNLLEGPMQAVVETTRASRLLSDTTAAIYKNMSADTEAENAEARRSLDTAKRGFAEKIALASTLRPQQAQELRAIQSIYDALFTGPCAETIRLSNDTSLADGNTRALDEMGRLCEPAIQRLLANLVTFNERLSAHSQTLSDSLTNASHETNTRTLAITFFATLLVIVIAIVLVRRGIVAPIHSMMATMQSLGEGKLGAAVAGTQRKDEIGAIAKALDVLRGQLAAGEEARQAKAAADEAARARLAHRNEIGTAFVQRMTELAASFASSSSQVADSARNLSAAAEQTSRQAQSVAEAAEEAASNVETVAAASEELATSVREITGQVSRSASVADVAYQEASASNTRIGTLANAASAIGDVISLIKGIADQTNLLALNATIESARAGEAGRGFAVVASEVKQLAGQTARATEEISAKIAEIQSATNGTVTSMDEIIRVIADMKQVSSSIAGAVEEQGAATGEIAHNCQRAASGTQQVTQSITGVGQAAELTGSASTELLALSEGLSGQASDLRTLVEAFVKDLDAA
ncbi:methyl-accepting chemotaxis protein [Azorhizobium oxalatiphilum]|nr:HAMP domain-containing methyl-accepting chemotaxis protein [Azorhizobium oxalatiphilum]